MEGGDTRAATTNARKVWKRFEKSVEKRKKSRKKKNKKNKKRLSNLSNSREWNLASSSVSLRWAARRNRREKQITKRYLLGRDDYKEYSTVCGLVQKLTNILTKLDATDPFRVDLTEKLLSRLYDAGYIRNKIFTQAQNMNVYSICKRRLSTMVVKLKLANTMKQAVRVIQYGHIRIGPEAVTTPDISVTRFLESLCGVEIHPCFFG